MEKIFADWTDQLLKKLEANLSKKMRRKKLLSLK